MLNNTLSLKLSAKFLQDNKIIISFQKLKVIMISSKNKTVEENLMALLNILKTSVKVSV